MRTSRIIRRSLAVINIMLVGVIGLAGAASAASTSPAPSTTAANAAVSQSVSADVFASFAPSTKAQQKTFTVTAPAAECALIHQPKGCKNIVTEGVSAVTVLRGPAAAAVSGNSTIQPAGVMERSAWDEECSAISCSVWHAKENATFDFTGGWVKSVYLNCGDHGGIAVNFDVNTCAPWNSGVTSQSPNGGQMFDEEVVEVAGVGAGIPISTSYDMKIWCNVDGEIWFA